MPSEFGAPTLAEWMDAYWTLQVRNPDLTARLPDGLGGIRLVGDVMSRIAAQERTIRSLQHRQRIKAHRAKLIKGTGKGIHHERMRRWSRQRSAT
jgi:hypothetical protein